MNRPTVKNEINLSTLALAVSTLATIFGGVYAVGQFTAQVDEIRAAQGVQSEQLKSVTAQSGDTAAKFDNLAYRTTVMEQANATRDKSLSDIRDALASQSADLRVIRQILSQFDKSAN